MKGIPAFLDSDYELSVSDVFEGHASSHVRDCYVTNLRLGPAGLQTSVDESLMGLPHHEFKYPQVIIDFVVANVEGGMEYTHELSMFHKLYKNQFKDDVPGIFYVKGYKVILGLASQKFPGVTNANFITFSSCRFGRPILTQLTSQGSGFLSFQVQMSYRDFVISDTISVVPTMNAVLSQLAFRSIETALMAAQAAIMNT